MFGGHRRRAGRGEVRYLILDALAEQPRHGYEIISEIESRTGGAYRPSPGTVYPTLQMLEELGHVEVDAGDGKKVYRLTEAGRTELDEHREEVDEAYDRLAGDLDPHRADDLFSLFERFPRVFKTVGRAYRRGKIGGPQLQQIRQVIDDAVQRIDDIARGKTPPASDE